MNDQEIIQLVGPQYAEDLAPSLEESSREGIFTSQQALEYVGGKIALKKQYGFKKSKADSARDALAGKRVCERLRWRGKSTEEAVWI